MTAWLPTLGAELNVLIVPHALLTLPVVDR